jgi:hypothetical protein
MMKIYVMFAVIGWSWALLIGAVMLIRRLRTWKRSSGFDVVVPDEKQH